jgi:3-oxoacyl-(acyl-carrier-protein) synthase
MGILSALGKTQDENLQSLRNGNSGIASTKHLLSKYTRTHVFAEVDASNEELLNAAGLAGQAGLTRTDLLALLAFREAVKDAGRYPEQISSAGTALLSASTVGGMCLTQELYADSHLQGTGSPYLSSYACGAHTLELAKRYQMRGYTDTINTACSSSANAIMLGARLIRAGKIKRAIVGGSDSLSLFTINGFNSLQILSDKPCKPFDEHRKGLTLGEGAAYLVLEAEEECKNKKIYAVVSGYGNSNDAFHPSSLSEEATGVVAAINGALATSDLDPGQISFINAHGTATLNNDVTELRGILKTFGRIPPYASTKSYTGHTLAAAGAIEAVYSILCIRHNEMYASLYCDTPMKEFDSAPVSAYTRHAGIDKVMSNSFGFAGNCSSLIFEKA